jgi:hypothetical protein
LSTCFGWTWEYIDEFVTLPRLKEITAYQKKHPALHELVAAFMGVGTKKGPKQVDAAETNNMDQFFAEMGALGVDLQPLITP